MKKFVKNNQSLVTSILIIMLLTIPISPIISVTAEEDYVVTKDWVLNNLQNPNVIFLDVRSFDEYLGVDTQATRGGHIPGAINIEWTYCYDFNGTYKQENELQRMFETAGVIQDKIIVVYCHTGQHAESIYDTLLMLDYTQLFVYEGSWVEWGNDPETPIETTCKLALVSGPKNNTETSCTTCPTGPFTGLYYSYLSELTGVKRLLALGFALLNSNVTRLMINFTTMGFIPQIWKANATKMIYEDEQGIFNEKTVVVIPFKPIGSKNENVTHAEVVSQIGTVNLAGAVSEEIIEGKTWTTYYWVNQTGDIETLSVDPCDWVCLASCILQHPEIWAQCIYACWCVPALPYLCGPFCLLCILGLGSIGMLCSVPCGCWEPPEVTIRVETSPVHDSWSRYHGVSLDSPLSTYFWNDEPGKIIKTTPQPFTWEQSYVLDSGSHYFIYSVSSYWPDYYWNAKIYVNNQLVAQGDVGYNHQLQAYFTV
jgi:rhodanese-related sulfurtransferase